MNRTIVGKSGGLFIVPVSFSWGERAGGYCPHPVQRLFRSRDHIADMGEMIVYGLGAIK
jgi:hypothetical protein